MGCQWRIGDGYRMKIILIRHGKVTMEWKDRYTSSAFDAAVRRYDLSTIAPVRERIENRGYMVYASAMPRTGATAKALFGKKPDGVWKELNEVPICSFMDTKRRLPLKVWNVMGRLQWFFGSKRQKETRNETVARAARVLDALEREGGDCYVVTHGFFLRVLLKELKRRKYTVEKDKHIRINNLARLVAEK